MAIDMKEMIANEAIKLIFVKKVKKLTVKDIVEACHITRQAFYYHFSGIPELLEWTLRQKDDEFLDEIQNSGDREEQIKRFLILVINGHSAVKRGLESNYGEEIERLSFEKMQNLFRRMVSQQGALQNCDPIEEEFTIRYHCQAIMGLLRQWSDEDTKNIDKITHTIFLIMSKSLFL